MIAPCQSCQHIFCEAGHTSTRHRDVGPCNRVHANKTSLLKLTETQYWNSYCRDHSHVKEKTEAGFPKEAAEEQGT